MAHGNVSWGIIGIGQLGASLVEGICRSGAPVTLFLSPRSESRVRELAARFPVVIGAHNQAIVDDADHVILAPRPDQILDVARGLRFRAEQVVVSVAALVKRACLQEAVGSASAVRAMPVLSAAVVDSPTCVFPGNDAAVNLFEHLGPVHAFEDEDTFTAAAVAATYYGWVYALMDASASWLHRNGVTADTSRALIAQMTRAASNRCLQSDRDMGTMAAEIARPGTFTGIGLDVLRERGALQAWGDACQRVLDAWQERER